jgi:hypothetical protein
MPVDPSSATFAILMRFGASVLSSKIDERFIERRAQIDVLTETSETMTLSLVWIFLQKS